MRPGFFLIMERDIRIEVFLRFFLLIHYACLILVVDLFALPKVTYKNEIFSLYQRLTCGLPCVVKLPFLFFFSRFAGHASIRNSL